MSVTLYDKAITEKIGKWVLDPNLTIFSPDQTTRLFTQTIDEKKDKPITLPLIAISREPHIDIDVPVKRPLTSRGKVFESTYQESSHLDAIGITPRYRIDIFTRKQEEADEYIRNLVFQIINYPKVDIELPYRDCNVKQTVYMRLEPSIDDNSDIPERKIPGQFTRETISFALHGAYLYSYPTRSVPEIISAEIDLDNIQISATDSDKVDIDTIYYKDKLK